MRVLAWALVLAGNGLVWIPAGRLGPVQLEAANLAGLAAVALALMAGPRPRVPAALWWLGGWTAWCALALAAHGSGDGGVLRIWALDIATAAALVSLGAPDRATLGRLAILAVAVLTAVLWLSARRAGVEPVAAVADYLSSSDRDAFLYGALRPTFNALAPAAAEPMFLVSLLNRVAAAYALALTILLLAPPPERVLAVLAGGLALAVVLVLFSSSAVLVAGAALAVAAARTARGRPLALAVMAIPAATAAAMGAAFVADNLGADLASRLARVDQMNFAMQAIDTSPIWGNGYMTLDGADIHNWPLFSWAVAGLPALVLCLVAYGAALRATAGAGALPVLLVLVFALRTAVGGAGGVASGAGIVALALALALADQRARSRPMAARAAFGSS